VTPASAEGGDAASGESGTPASTSASRLATELSLMVDPTTGDGFPPAQPTATKHIPKPSDKLAARIGAA
jgi:hypothetical protein